MKMCNKEALINATRNKSQIDFKGAKSTHLPPIYRITRFHIGGAFHSAYLSPKMDHSTPWVIYRNARLPSRTWALPPYPKRTYRHRSLLPDHFQPQGKSGPRYARGIEGPLLPLKELCCEKAPPDPVLLFFLFSLWVYDCSVCYVFTTSLWLLVYLCNVEGLGSNRKHWLALKAFRSSNAEVIMVQETHFKAEGSFKFASKHFPTAFVVSDLNVISR